MRNYTMPDREALRRIRPRSNANKRQLIRFIVFVVIGIAIVGAFVYVKGRMQRYREENWESAVATVEDVRPKLTGQFNNITGGGMLYNAEVLAKYPLNGATQERWILVEKSAANLDWINFQRHLWIGKTYVVRWKPNHPDQVEIEIF
jgi:nitrate reductase NapE component